MRLSRPFRFDPDKGLEILLYISNRISNKNIYWVLKTPYFADKYHLQDFGRPVSADVYYAMKDGPVPSGLYDIVKDVRDTHRKPQTLRARSAFKVDGNEIIPSRDADLDFLSKSDVRALDRAIEEIGSLSFAKLKKLSHDSAYGKADPNGEIPYDAIIETLPSADLILANS
jgi:uncharacterized phage-associated protein